MPPVCTVCSHREAPAIDEALRGGATARAVSAGYDLSYDAVARHSRNHLAARSAVGSQPPTDHASADPLDELADHLRRRALAGSDPASREYRLLLGQQAARSATAPPISFVTTDEWAELRGRILEALKPFPEARQAVADALEDA